MPVKYHKNENQIELIVYGSPVAQGRPRFSRQGGFVKTYDPIQSKSYKQLIRLELQPLLSDPGFKPIDKACCLKLKFSEPYRKVLVRKSEKKRYSDMYDRQRSPTQIITLKAYSMPLTARY